MERSLIAFAFLLILCVSSGAPDSSKAEDQECEFDVDAAKEAAKPISNLAIIFYRQFTKPDANSLFSPFAAAIALALAEPGAAGVTRDELLAVIGVNGSTKPYHSLQHQLQIRSEKARLIIANSIFLEEKLRLMPDYVNIAKKCFEAEVAQVPFQTRPEEARLRINQWIANRTADKIPELMKSGTIDSSTLAILARGIYFKAPWLRPFADGGEQPFYRSGKVDLAQKVKFMSLDRASFNYYSYDDFQVVELPYDGLALSMFIILPNKRDGIGALENSLTGDQLISIFGKTESQPVSLRIPKFTIRQTVASGGKLTDMLGIRHFFSDQANFSRMSKDEMKITRAVHEVFIEVSENGTEAVAASGKTHKPGGRTLITSSPIPFVADHPFIFAIVHKPTLTIIFMGKVNSIDKQ